jgi:hypothetical protein
LAAVVHRIAERAQKEAPNERAKKLLADTYLLTGLRVPRTVAAQIFKGVRVMDESDTYLAIIDEGQEKHAKKSILRLGMRRFGPTNQSIESALSSITDLDRLDRLLDRILDASSWKDLLDTP